MSVASTQESWWSPFNLIRDVSVLHVDLTPDRAHERYAIEWLDGEERTRLDQFQHHRPRRDFSLCRAALRSILCQRLGCRNQDLVFATSRYGKPVAQVGGKRVSLHFNVSHSGQHGLIAICPSSRVGVDVEVRVPRTDLEGTVGMILAPAEWKVIDKVKGQQKIHLLYQLWTMKEALVKALGLGFSQDMTQFEILPAIYQEGAQDAVFQFSHAPEVKWQLTDLGNDEFAAALALEVGPEANGQSISASDI